MKVIVRPKSNMYSVFILKFISYSLYVSISAPPVLPIPCHRVIPPIKSSPSQKRKESHFLGITHYLLSSKPTQTIGQCTSSSSEARQDSLFRVTGSIFYPKKISVPYLL